MIVTRFMKPEDELLVESYVESHDWATIYHTIAWKKILENTYKYVSRYIVCLDNNRVVGVLPLVRLRNYKGQKKIVGLPFSHFVQPLYNSPEALNAMIGFAENTAKKMNAGYLEIKSKIENRDHWCQTAEYMVSELELTRSTEEILKGLKPSVRRNLKKAQASGISVRIENCRPAFDHFYDLMVETRQRQGSPPYARCFFDNLHRFLDSSQRSLYMAYKGTQPIAGLIMLTHGKRSVYAYGASRSDRTLLLLRPNELLFWTAIEDARQSGCNVFDFGITPFGHSSLLRFKSQWGTDNRKLFYSYFLCRSKMVPHINRSGAIANISSKAFKILPKPLFKTAGPILLRFLG